MAERELTRRASTRRASTRRAQFSVYNNRLGRAQRRDHPLAHLLPDDYEHGWHVARNLLKPLNHLAFLRRQEATAAELHLHNRRTPARWFDQTYELLAQHQAGQVSTGAVIAHLARQLRRAGRPLSEAEIAARLRRYARVCHMEVHPSDVCNLSCRDCTYGHDDPDRKPPPVTFPFSAIGEIARMNPRSMVIIGGGEPTLYRSEGRGFQEMVEAVCRTNPGIALALVTNGTHKPPGDWPRRMRWIRLSLDAASAATYAAFRGKPMFQRVLDNFLRLLLQPDLPHRAGQWRPAPLLHPRLGARLSAGEPSHGQPGGGCAQHPVCRGPAEAALRPPRLSPVPRQLHLRAGPAGPSGALALAPGARRSDVLRGGIR